ncbi:hypothetical protein AB0J86_06710 [Micromonospora sp. NPDC049559]|uniref:hypothetical protein n=1 Tax=Micromonospora sp. NPDC049559 TaxID=3155923 RepID=UPI0034305039
MTKESGITATSGRRPARSSRAAGEPPAARSTEVLPAPGAGAFAVIAVAWLAAMLWSGQRSITSANVDSIAISMTALSLPGVISASLLSGAATGLAATNLLARRGVVRTAPRFTVAVGAGLLVGVLAAVAVTATYGGDPVNMVLAGAIAAAATIGGAAGGLRSAPMIGGVVAAGMAVFAASYVMNQFEHPLLSLYGSGESLESRVTALEWFLRTAWLVGGVLAGLVAFAYLRWEQRRAESRQSTRPGLRWPAYLIAGAGPGLLLLATEALTWTAGGRVLELARALSESDDTAQGWLGSSRFDYALGVLFVGAFVALIAFGRTLRPPADPAADPASEPPAGPGATDAAEPVTPGDAPEVDGEPADGEKDDDEALVATATPAAGADDKAATAGR